MSNTLKHTKTILTHKWWVFYYACKCGIPWRGFMHDWSKFSPVEFWESVKYYQGTSSPINACKADIGYSRAWQHHKGRNPHHYEYWTDNYDSGTTCICIPFIYTVEMICDWLAAGRTYQGDAFTLQDEYEWIIKKLKTAKIHPKIKVYLCRVFLELATADPNVILKKNVLRYFYEEAINADTSLD